METCLLYILKVCAASSVMVIAYMAFFRKQNLFQFNRFYLLAAALIPWIFPLVTITIIRQVETLPGNALMINPMVYGSVEAGSGIGEAAGSVNLLVMIPFVLYISGLVFFMLRLIMSFFRIKHIIQKSHKERLCNENIFVNDGDLMPFSFLNKIVIGKDLKNHHQLNLIIRHEKIHVCQWHSIDILATEIFKIFQWFNPFAWMLGTHVKTNLEYIADTGITKTGGDVRKYQYVLISLANGNIPMRLVSGFNQTQLKKRIVMMKKNMRKDRLNATCLLVLPVVAILLLSFCNREIKYVTQDDLVVTGQVTTVAYNIPIPEVYVGVKGQITGTATDANGEYGIALNNPDDTLEVIYNYMIQETIVPNGRTNIDIKLKDPDRFLHNVERILGPESNPVVIVNDQRIEKGIRGIDPRYIQTIQVLEGNKAVQKAGSEDARGGLVLISRSDYNFFEDNVVVFLDGKKYDRPLASINPNFRRSMSFFSSTMFFEPGTESAGKRFIVNVTTKNAEHVEMINREVMQMITGKKKTDPADEPIVVLNGKMYDKGIRSIDPDGVVSAQLLTGEDAVEISGLEEAGERGLVFIMSKNP